MPETHQLSINSATPSSVKLEWQRFVSEQTKNRQLNPSPYFIEEFIEFACMQIGALRLENAELRRQQRETRAAVRAQDD